MAPPPTVALLLLGLWILVVFAATNATAYGQWRAADECEGTGYYAPSHDDSRADESTATARAVRADRSEYASDGVGPVADD